MNILIVSQYFWPENFRINDFAIALKERGHSVTVLTGMPNYPEGRVYKNYGWLKQRREMVDNISIIRVPLFTRHQSKSWQLILNYFSFAISACLFGAWMLRKISFDIVFTYEVSPVTVGIPGILMKHLKGVPMLFWVQDLWPESLSATGAVKSKLILFVVGKMVKWIYSHCDKILVQSKGFVSPAVAVGAKLKKIKYFPNWAETFYKPVQLSEYAKEKEDVPDTGFVIMFAGNLGVAQSLETIVEAAEKLKEKDIHWVFLGDGRKYKWLKDVVEEKGLTRVHVLGRKPLQSMPAYFSLADAMLVTLREDPIMMTTIPGKIQSYLACAKPIIGALNGEGAKVINDSGAGFSVASGDSIGLAKTVLKMSAFGSDKLSSMGQSALQYNKENFDRDMLLDDIELCFKDLVKGSG